SFTILQTLIADGGHADAVPSGGRHEVVPGPQGRVAGGTVGTHHGGDVLGDPGPRVRVPQALQDAVDAALGGPGRETRMQVGAAGGVGVLVKGDVESLV